MLAQFDEDSTICQQSVQSDCRAARVTLRDCLEPLFFRCIDFSICISIIENRPRCHYGDSSAPLRSDKDMS